LQKRRSSFFAVILLDSSGALRGFVAALDGGLQGVADEALVGDEGARGSLFYGG
jgi:hypothetical protein